MALAPVGDYGNRLQKRCEARRVDTHSLALADLYFIGGHGLDLLKLPVDRDGDCAACPRIDADDDHRFLLVSHNQTQAGTVSPMPTSGTINQ